MTAGWFHKNKNQLLPTTHGQFTQIAEQHCGLGIDQCNRLMRIYRTFGENTHARVFSTRALLELSKSPDPESALEEAASQDGNYHNHKVILSHFVKPFAPSWRMFGQEVGGAGLPALAAGTPAGERFFVDTKGGRLLGAAASRAAWKPDRAALDECLPQRRRIAGAK